MGAADSRVIVALDKFKGSIDAAGATAAVIRGLSRLRPELSVLGFPVADGGEGTLDALVAAEFRHVPVTAAGPTGEPVATGYVTLAALDRVDLDRLHPRLRPGSDRAELVVACDVDNPLLGPHGAAAVYGPQKGATAEQVARLGTALARWAQLLEQATGVPAAATPGAGAAGGVGFAALALGARMRGGIELVLELTGMARLLPGARLVITGEGSLDAQTLRGKAPAGVAAAARAAGVPVAAVAGRNLLGPDQLAAAGIVTAFALTDLQPDPNICIRDAARLLERTGERIARELLDRSPIRA